MPGRSRSGAGSAERAGACGALPARPEAVRLGQFGSSRNARVGAVLPGSQKAEQVVPTMLPSEAGQCVRRRQSSRWIMARTGQEKRERQKRGTSWPVWKVVIRAISSSITRAADHSKLWIGSAVALALAALYVKGGANVKAGPGSASRNQPRRTALCGPNHAGSPPRLRPGAARWEAAELR
jgi:hypothetical protein